MGLSIRAYAKVRGVSHVAVLKAIKAGRIPIEPDGAIDPGKADAAWARSTDPGRTKSRTKAKPSPENLKPVAEAAVGLGILIALFRNKETVLADQIDLLKW